MIVAYGIACVSYGIIWHSVFEIGVVIVVVVRAEVRAEVVSG